MKQNKIEQWDISGITYDHELTVRPIEQLGTWPIIGSIIDPQYSSFDGLRRLMIRRKNVTGTTEYAAFREFVCHDEYEIMHRSEQSIQGHWQKAAAELKQAKERIRMLEFALHEKGYGLLE